MQTLTIIFIIFLLSSCAVVPKFSEEKSHSNCDLIIKEMELDVAGDPGQCFKGVSDIRGIPFCLGIASIIMGTTAVIAGSVVLTNNTLHWLEKQGKCNDSLLNMSVLKHNKPLLEKNGKLITPPFINN